ncbi:nucleotide-binding universal stress UspA family protein [Paraburkholderia bannensis]|uniref:Nucleotide-binding universal stress UspA family protein n=1 Tax=Paraburkholderia bannensis TaxID=765414 RepID=A0A7W9U6Z2_9BURK|nr:MULTISPECIES: universal stress protein [Paraburkholderia]MBB3262111.1 nucleotide-binding universal stress UspA family protein [Paraburkholderia sp. WP4_3_2]MBB6107090.1 nucleotide-binding universal stress UspA family protein [Paraburkholderia bannensis]
MYSSILVAIDGSKTASHALDTSIRLALDSQAQLMPLYVIDLPVMVYDVPGFDPSIMRDAYFEERRLLCVEAQAKMITAGVQGIARSVEASLVAEDIAHCIVRVAAEFNADLIIMGTHGRRGVRRLVLGSVAERVLRIAQCPILLIPSRTFLRESATQAHAGGVTKIAG